MESLNLITEQNSKNPAAEAFRVIRTSIQFAQAGTPLRKLMLTSCTPDEGKSTTVANLAVVLTQNGSKVLLMDCDMRNPTVHKKFKLSNKVGLSNCISMGTALADAVQETSVENLYVLTAGVIPPNPSELLNSERMKNILERAEEEFDYVLIDTPPVLPVADALIMASLADGVIMLLESGGVKVELARDVKAQLLNAGANILGVVLNKVKSEHHGYGYGYYYYYGHESVRGGDSGK